MFDIQARMRAIEADPELRRLYLNVAGEIVTAGTENPDNIIDEDFAALNAEDRDRFLEHSARKLMPHLIRAALAWTIFESTTVADWRAEMAAQATRTP